MSNKLDNEVALKSTTYIHKIHEPKNNNASSADTSKSNVDFTQEGVEDKESDNNIDPNVQKRLIRKLDIRILSWLTIALLFNTLDQNNLQNAFVMGMAQDLDLESSAFNWAVTMFFIGYTLLQIPGNIFIAKYSPRWILASSALLWGMLVCVMAFVKTHNELYALRIVLGFVQSPFYPGATFVLGSWYTSEELAKRMNIYFSISTACAGAFGGLIAGGISDSMEGARGLPAWKWLFIIEGLVTIVIGLAGYFLLGDSPHNTKWLAPEERKVALLRVKDQRGADKSIYNFQYWKGLCKTIFFAPFTWVFIIAFACSTFGINMTYNFPIILSDMGYTGSFANYMLTPLYFFMSIGCCIIAWTSDKTGDRVFHIIGLQVYIAILYLIMALVGHGDNPIALVFVGTYASSICMGEGPLIFSWINEIYKEDHHTRAVAIAVINSVGYLIPQFMNVKLWVVTDSPQFWVGKISTVAISIGSIPLILLLWYMLRVDSLSPMKPIKKENILDDGR